MKGLQTNRTVVPCRIGQADMIGKPSRFDADPALVTVRMLV